MFDARGNGLDFLRAELNHQRRHRRRSETEASVEDHDLSPRPGGNPMGTAKTGGHGLLIPLGAGPGQAKPVRELGAVTQRAVQRGAQPRFSFVGVEDPRSELERRAVTDMLVVPAGQLGYPVVFVVGVKARDCTLHKARNLDLQTAA